MNLILFGFQACGKSTVGSLAAKKLNKTFIDIDSVLEDIYYNPLLSRHQRLRCREIYSLHGEDFLKALEKDAIKKLRLIKRGVVEIRGEILIDYYNHAEMKKNSLFIYLKISQEEIEKRIVDLQLPVVSFEKNESSFDSFYQERDPIYEHIADVVIETDRVDPLAVVEKICCYARD